MIARILVLLVVIAAAMAFSPRVSRMQVDKIYVKIIMLN